MEEVRAALQVSSETCLGPKYEKEAGYLCLPFIFG
jgi:hypothetical protein